ncbi:MFS transporter [Spirillospora sp. NPDC000708]
MIVVGFALMGSSFFFSQFFVYVQGGSILRPGVQTLPATLAMVVVSPFAGRLAARYGFRIMVTIGLTPAGLGLLALGFVHADTGYTNVWWRLAVVGIGFALAMSPLTGAAIQSVSPQEGGLASGVSSTTRQIGAVLGVAVLGAVVRTRRSGGASFEQGLDSAFVVAGRRHPGDGRAHRPVAGQEHRVVRAGRDALHGERLVARIAEFGAPCRAVDQQSGL